MSKREYKGAPAICGRAYRSVNTRGEATDRVLLSKRRLPGPKERYRIVFFDDIHGRIPVVVGTEAWSNFALLDAEGEIEAMGEVFEKVAKLSVPDEHAKAIAKLRGEVAAANRRGNIIQ